MAKRKARKKAKTKQAEYDFLSLEVSSFKASVDAAVSYRVRDKKHHEEDARVFDFHSNVEIVCRSLWPEERAGCDYHLTISGHELEHAPFSMTLDDCQIRDEFGERQYTKRSGEQVPVYCVPKGIGYLEKLRGEKAWSGVAWVSRQCISDMLMLLPTVRPLYVFIHELRNGKNRSIVGLTLQTTDPTEE